ncbi:MAG: pantoate--beta-alanine ligase [Alphaproteobacteria bacterium]|nr:pantoate--beta-alanine ligase [Alphaproteobacteria bacterium]
MSARSAGSIDTVRTVSDLRARVAAWRAQGDSIGLVATMGSLHAGHLALVHASLAACRRTVTTIFVNPTQFGPEEDYTVYPRDEAGDTAKLDALGVDLLYAPPLSEIYGPDFAVSIDVGPLADDLCGAVRPGFFTGVSTVVAKLLIQAAPDRAYFGEKDYQQLQIVRRLAADLDLAVAIEAVETVREPDGLALSSRNAYLKPEERAAAPALYRTLNAVAERIGADTVDHATAWAVAELEAAGFGNIDYVAVRDAVTLAPVEGAKSDRSLRVLAAAWLGAARLIDNVPA